MKPYLDKTHTSITVSEKMGYYHLACLKKTRWIWGILMNAFILMLILSIRIWNIRINGNKSLSDITIIDYVNKIMCHMAVFHKKIMHGLKKY